MKKKKVLAALLICLAILFFVGGVAFYKLTHPFKIEAVSIELLPIDDQSSMNDMLFYHNIVSTDANEKVFYNPEFKINEEDFENYCQLKLTVKAYNKSNMGWVVMYASPKKYGKVFGFEAASLKSETADIKASVEVISSMYLYRNGMTDDELLSFIKGQSFELVYEDNHLGKHKMTIRPDKFIK